MSGLFWIDWMFFMGTYIWGIVMGFWLHSLIRDARKSFKGYLRHGTHRQSDS